MVNHNLGGLGLQRGVTFDIITNKETTLERADFTLQLLMFVTADKEGQLFIIILLSSLCPFSAN